MKHAILLALVAASAPAAAQPACRVFVATAPSDVRWVVEEWVRREQRCTASIDVRIVEQDGQLHILATDEHGLARERTVPDAESAGALIASWAVDPQDVVPAGAPPGETPAVIVPRPAGPPPHWLSLGGMIVMSGNAGEGGRLAIDMAVRGRWSFGALAAVADIDSPMVGVGIGTLRTRDFKGLGYVAYTLAGTQWRARASFGVGVVETSALAMVTDANGMAVNDAKSSSPYPTAEASVLVGYAITSAWGVELGPVWSWQRFLFEDDSPGPQGFIFAEHGGDFMGYLGLMHTL